MTTSVLPEHPRTENSEHPSPAVAHARGELTVAAAVAAIGVFVLARTGAMDVPSSVSFLGPRFFPGLVGGLLVLLAVAMAARGLVRGREPGAAATREVERSDRKPLLLVAATLIAFVLLLQPAGWILAGAMLFWGVSLALGSEHRLRDLGISLIVSSAVQLVFSAGLGLSLPAGVLLGVL